MSAARILLSLGHVDGYDDCDLRVARNCCRNQHCPRCQGAAARGRLAGRVSDLLPIGYFHVVFTPPAEIGDIALHNKTARRRPPGSLDGLGALACAPTWPSWNELMTGGLLCACAYLGRV